MPSPGEFVVNSQSAGKFYSPLSATNAGMTPTFKQDGGSVGATQIGDNVCNINGAECTFGAYWA